MSDEHIELIMVGGELRARRPWCDCTSERRRAVAGGVLGYTKRSDGVWVRPCCMRREKAAWEKLGNEPASAEYINQVHTVKE